MIDNVIEPKRPRGIDKDWLLCPSLGVVGTECWMQPATSICVVSSVRHESPLEGLPKIPYYRLEMSVMGKARVPERAIAGVLADFDLADAERQKKAFDQVHAVFWIPVSEAKP